jgi:hypothetical protein
MFKDIRRFSQGDKSYTKIVKYFIKNEQDLFTPDLIKQYPVLYEIKDAGGIVSWWDKSTADYRYFWLRNEELREKNKEEFDRLENIVIENLKFLLEKLKSLNGLID